MRKIIYYVASSIDGFIAGPQGDISSFNTTGNGVDQYLVDLQAFDTVIMGRETYEFGYKFGVKPGMPAYNHMEHFIFSKTLTFENSHEKVHVFPPDLQLVKDLKDQEGSAIYLCGGGIVAGWLLKNKMIDELKIKLNPFIQGEGIRLFGNYIEQVPMLLLDSNGYENGLQILEYKIIY